MNGRIRELAHEAGLPTYNPEGIPTKLEKFAELIIQECIEWCDAHATIDGTAQQVRNSIKNHFGV